MKWIEVIGAYVDGEAVDVLVNVHAIRCVRPKPQDPENPKEIQGSIIEWACDGESLLGVDEPYEVLKSRILEAGK